MKQCAHCDLQKVLTKQNLAEQKKTFLVTTAADQVLLQIVRAIIAACQEANSQEFAQLQVKQTGQNQCIQNVKESKCAKNYVVILHINIFFTFINNELHNMSYTRHDKKKRFNLISAVNHLKTLKISSIRYHTYFELLCILLFPVCCVLRRTQKELFDNYIILI